ncbi:MAG: LysM peptidoglycan-binding domain-containing protein, partial [Deltaproteobacteria bacterium]|nr:LysM peptidoglycan-binding domain-containing protein [Deltaproteobacteria bacterium]
GLAVRYNTSVAELRRLNNMRPAAALQKGRKLKLPGGADPHKPVVAAPSPALSERPSYHVVQAGDTLSGLAVRYNTSIAELRRLNNMSPAAALQKGRKLKLPGGADPHKPVVAAPSPAHAERPSYHVVQAGDTLSGLAVRYNTSVAELRRLNNMSPAAALQKGRKLKLPGGGTPEPAAAKEPPAGASERPSYHVVQRGETLSELAARYNTTVAELRRLNSMSPADALQAGVTLKLM